MGKSGIIANKIAATLASTGTPSFFMHPSEAYHGDLGMISKDDAVILISNSGETDEILRLIPHIKGNVKLIISMTGKPDSTLAINSDYNIDISVQHEACPLQAYISSQQGRHQHDEHPPSKTFRLALGLPRKACNH